jgi:dipeptidyl-peptidase 4
MRRLAVPFLLLVSFVVAAAAQEQPKPLTVERYSSPEFREAVGTPQYEWLADGGVLLLDRRVPRAKRTFERLDPRTLARTPACNATTALASLATAMGGDAKEAPKSLGWPESLTASGDRAVYSFAGDLYLLDLARSSFRRLTTTTADEKDPRLSPDGTRVAYVRGNNLFTLDLASGKETAVTSDGGGAILNGTLSWVYWEEIFDRRDDAFWWSPDGAKIAFFRTDDSHVDEAVFPMWEPPTAEVKRQRYPVAGGVNPTVKLGVADLVKGSTTWVDLGEPKPEYIVRVAWLPSGERLAVQTLDRLQRTLTLRLADPADGRSRVLLTETAKTSVAIGDELVFVEHGRKFIWASERDGHNHLYLYAADGTLVRQLTHGDMMVRASSGLPGSHGGVVAVDETTHLVYFTASTGSPVAPALYRVNWRTAVVERISREMGAHRIGFDGSARRYLDTFSNASTPPSLSLHRADGTLVGVVTPPATDFLAPFKLVTPSFLTVAADDGFPLPAEIAKPRDFDPTKKYPVVVYVYGGPGAPVVWDAWQRETPFDNILLDRGYICFAVDPRAATGESKTLRDTSYDKLESAYEVPDIAAAVRWLDSQPWVDAGRIGIWGWSGGGTTTLQMMTHTTLFKAGIAVAALTDPRYYDTVWTESILGLPDQDPEGYKAGAPANFAADLHGRVLLVCGTYDDNVHPQNTWRMAHELIQAGIMFDMMVYPGQKHGIYSPKDNIHVFNTMLDFWQRNL